LFAFLFRRHHIVSNVDDLVRNNETVV